MTIIVSCSVCRKDIREVGDIEEIYCKKCSDDAVDSSDKAFRNVEQLENYKEGLRKQLSETLKKLGRMREEYDAVCKARDSVTRKYEESAARNEQLRDRLDEVVGDREELTYCCSGCDRDLFTAYGEPGRGGPLYCEECYAAAKKE